MTQTLRLGVIGCGAIAETAHIPALIGLGQKPMALADRDPSRAQCLAERFGIPGWTADYRELIGEIDAAIVAVPPAAHAGVSLELLSGRTHVLVEKPMAVTWAECRKMLASAIQHNVSLSVGLMRRFLGVNQWLHEVILDGRLGTIHTIDIREGTVFDWPVKSSAFFQRHVAGGGVLIDIGSHVVDLLVWLVGSPRVSSYFDDFYGGLEADCLVEFELMNGGVARVELSRTRQLRNTLVVRGELGSIEVSLHENRVLEITDNGPQGNRRYLRVPVLKNQSFVDLFRRELADWIKSIATSSAPLSSASDAAETIKLIEQCYSQRQEWDLPWIQFVADGSPDKIGMIGHQRC